MSLQKCHCGWSKVTTYQGLRIHQREMGCTPRGQKDEECGQLYVRGPADYEKDFKLDVCTPIKNADFSSDVSLQECHCGWSKVTTYQHLRLHKGKMGCMPKGRKDEECRQPYVGGLADYQEDSKVDIDMPIANARSYLAVSLRKCHCGWSKKTTYQGLRCHQGKMGCMPKGERIQKEEQSFWKKKMEKEDQLKHDPAKTVAVKKQGIMEADLLDLSSVFSKVLKVAEDAEEEPLDRPFSKLRTTTSTELAATELKSISNFAVNVKLDPTTAYKCLVSADGKRLSSTGETQRSGSVLGLNQMTSGKSYWEVVVSKKTGWSLGVATGDAQRKGKFLLCPDNGYWVAEHYKNKFAALTDPPVGLPLKEKPQKVGVFVDYEEGLVSFYDVTAQSHIYSFTECSFTEGIYPYFILHVNEDGSSEPLIIATVKRQ